MFRAQRKRYRSMSKPTIYQVADAAKVSIASVSRVLGDKPGVSAATRARIKAAMRALHYVPSGAAQGLASSSSGTLGLVFPDLDDPSMGNGHETLLYFDEVIRGAEREAKGSGFSVLIVSTNGPAGLEPARSIGGKVDGLVVLARSLREQDIRSLAESVPVVVLAAGRRIKGTDHVVVDNHDGMACALRHLVEGHGYTDIGFVAGPAHSPDAQGRLRGFRAGLARFGLAGQTTPIASGDFTEAGGRRAARALLASGCLPRAIVCANDQMAIGAMATLQDAGVSLPDQVAVVGFDDIPLGRYIRPSLTTVRQPMRQLGAACVDILLERLGGAPLRKAPMVLAVDLTIRDSCGPAHAPAPQDLPEDNDNKEGNEAR